MKQLTKADNLKLSINKEYKNFLKDIKDRIKITRLRAALAANQEIVKFYWELGKLIIQKQAVSNWGDKLVEALAIDLKKSFPDTQGFSRTNLHYMKKFAEIYPSVEIVQALPGQLPWTHNLILLERTKSAEERVWYAQQCLEHGWSYRVLGDQIKDQAYKYSKRKLLKTTNFKTKLPAPQSQLAEEVIKDPYRFHFLTMGDDAHEREVQRGLVAHINQFLLELGQGFAYYASNYAFKLSSKTYELDLLMYHTRLHCYVVIEIKRDEFKPKDAGQLNFYLSAIDKLLKAPEDNPTIGILLCEKKDRVIAEYALQDINKPMGISEYELLRKLPKEIRGALPTIEEIEAELNPERPKKVQRNIKF